MTQNQEMKTAPQNGTTLQMPSPSVYSCSTQDSVNVQSTDVPLPARTSLPDLPF